MQAHAGSRDSPYDLLIFFTTGGNAIMTDYSEATLATKEKLAADLRLVIADAEELLQITSSQTGDKVAELRARVGENLRVARAKLSEADAALRDKAREAARATDDYVHENPWRSIGIAAGAGLLVGLLIGRR
ncbi:DUF883 family protein [Candidatus Skiveiella danica]|jgi:ElaB/YqjD/DUF883 family membrane-anchored ribosome-binding protein|uniref:DUF883 family protein n=1 Tax=Candidatus Skiveiella danica TaxID=3386177 RepID=UPI0039B9B26A